VHGRDADRALELFTLFIVITPASEKIAAYEARSFGAGHHDLDQHARSASFASM